MTKITGYFCGPGLYEFEGWFFEYGPCGPWPLRKDGEPFKRAGRKFWDMFTRWSMLTEKQRAATKVGGGCQPITGTYTVRGKNDDE